MIRRSLGHLIVLEIPDTHQRKTSPRMRTVLTHGATLLLLCAGSARADQIAVTVAQAGSHATMIGRPYDAACGTGACRLAMPVQVFGIKGMRCVIDLYVTYPDRNRVGEIKISVGPCRNAMRLAVAPEAAVASYQLDAAGVGEATLSLPFEAAFAPPTDLGVTAVHSDMDDGVWRPSATIRVDIASEQPTP